MLWAAGQSQYKQFISNADCDDAYLFSICMAPLRLTAFTENNQEILVFQNPSTSYCWPIKPIFRQERETFEKLEIEKNQKSNLFSPTQHSDSR
ncbi:hypothetical protein TNIN_238841 [Trichonephila inaurata madagascariensis]|uniref:Uncharacterized protein n=1 Tax=Trichonephila inaurata madagascariensis TaxID=2747483 RepID=A0A8X6WXJ0_9ARAC|nr:hypothetical protein TNIN_238841 [Trichonephila inaurata madagascariensis]